MKSGDKYSKLTAIKQVRSQRSALWQFRCDCGQIVEKYLTNVQYGNTKSCGCLYKKQEDFRVELLKLNLSADDIEKATGENRRKVLRWIRGETKVKRWHIEKIKEYLKYANADKK